MKAKIEKKPEKVAHAKQNGGVTKKNRKNKPSEAVKKGLLNAKGQSDDGKFKGTANLVGMNKKVKETHAADNTSPTIKKEVKIKKENTSPVVKKEITSPVVKKEKGSPKNVKVKTEQPKLEAKKPRNRKLQTRTLLKEIYTSMCTTGTITMKEYNLITHLSDELEAKEKLGIGGKKKRSLLRKLKKTITEKKYKILDTVQEIKPKKGLKVKTETMDESEDEIPQPIKVEIDFPKPIKAEKQQLKPIKVEKGFPKPVKIEKGLPKPAKVENNDSPKPQKLSKKQKKKGAKNSPPQKVEENNTPTPKKVKKQKMAAPSPQKAVKPKQNKQKPTASPQGKKTAASPLGKKKNAKKPKLDKTPPQAKVKVPKPAKLKKK